MATSTVAALVPAPVRRAAQRLRTLWDVGAFSDPVAFARQWRHRAAFARLQKSLFYHRYATAVLLAREVGLWDALPRAGARGRSAADVAAACGIQARAAEHLLRILEGQDLAERAADRAGAADGDTFRATAFADAYLRTDGPHTIAPMLDLMAAQAAAFAEMPAALQTGRVPAALDIFSTGARYRAFLDAVNAYLRWAGAELLARAALPPVERFIVGSMGVSFSALVLERYPAARVTYGCLEHLVREIPRLRDTYAVPPHRVNGMHAHAGDPSADRWGDEPERYDLVFLTRKMILEPERRTGERFARKAFDVLRPGGAAVFWETIHPDAAKTPLGRAMEGVLDLCAGPAATVLTESRVRVLLAQIGFASVEVVACLGGQTTFVVARRP